jgi:hypothetical protein
MRHVSIGIPAPVLLQGRPLSALIAPALHAQTLEQMAASQAAAQRPREPGSGAGQGPYQPGGALAVGLRAPFGPTHTYYEPTRMDRWTGFYANWGTPPDSEFFAWDPQRRVYRVLYPASLNSSRGDEREWLDAVWNHHALLAGQNIYLQAYKEGEQYGSGPWNYRWIHVDPSDGQKYVNVGDGYESRGYRKTVADFAHERENLESEQARLAAERQYDIDRTDFGAAAQAWRQANPGGKS